MPTGTERLAAAGAWDSALHRLLYARDSRCCVWPVLVAHGTSQSLASHVLAELTGRTPLPGDGFQCFAEPVHGLAKLGLAVLSRRLPRLLRCAKPIVVS